MLGSLLILPQVGEFYTLFVGGDQLGMPPEGNAQTIACVRGSACASALSKWVRASVHLAPRRQDSPLLSHLGRAWNGSQSR